MSYTDFLNSKIKIAEKNGFDVAQSDIHPILKPHQKDVVIWACKGGTRAGFLSFGLGKTIIQLEVLRQVINQYSFVDGWPSVLIVCPLGVKQEFIRDGKMIGIDNIQYITNSDQVSEEGDNHFYITNYERIRQGDVDPSKFIAVTFDEASILRGLDTLTSDVIISEFASVKYRFVFTATPAPNRFLELTNYAHYLGIMDRGQILTRFFERDSTTAGNLTLFKNREKEFWYWMSSWACFVTKPSDLKGPDGKHYSDKGYDLPPIDIKEHKVTFDRPITSDKKTGIYKLTPDSSKSLQDSAVEKRMSITPRVDKMVEILENDSESHFLIWHHQEEERHQIQKRIGSECKSVWGSQKIEQREEYLIGFGEGKYKYLSTKPEIAGSGCNFQHHCHKAVFVGINYKFNDFIQAVHRIYRFLQNHQVEIHIIYTDAEDKILEALKTKWTNHLKLQNEMTEIIKKHGLNSDLYREDLKREVFQSRDVFRGDQFEAINNDNVKEMPNIKSDSVGMICTSIPFGNHYEYSENFNCFGHNETNEKFFEQMDFLTPELYRSLMPGRIAVIHVKDRIRYSYMNGTGFTSIEPFSDHTSMHFIKHGFHLMGRVTITTDVVQENAQTYRLGWGEQCKDGSKMGVGLPEYLLIFRKPPTESNNAYADIKVVKTKEGYSRAKWQLDAHSYWKTSGERLFSIDDLKKTTASDVMKLWKDYQLAHNYSIDEHQELCEKLDQLGKLPTKYMAAPVISNNPDVWTDIVRMKTLNADQVRKKMTKHICPLQLDIIERSIIRWSNESDVVLDPFAGIMSVPYMAVKLKRRGLGIELNKSYWQDGCKHLQRLATSGSQQSILELLEKVS